MRHIVWQRVCLFVISFLCLSGTLWAQSDSIVDFDVDGLGYVFAPDSLAVEVRGLSGVAYEGALVIPQEVTYEGNVYPVKYIGIGAFSDCGGITSVTIPPSVECIDIDAFSYCKGITSVTLPPSVKYVGDCAFLRCKSLREVNFPDALDFLGGGAFNGCTALTSVSLPKVVGTWAYGVFRYCTGLKHADIPYIDEVLEDRFFEGCTALSDIRFGDSVRIIVNDMFGGCTSLREITLPASVAKIEGNPFVECTSLAKLRVASGNPYYQVVDNVLFDKEQTTLIACAGTKKGAYAVPATVECIGDHAFEGCSALTSISIPASVETIGWNALAGCSSLGSLRVAPDNPVYMTTEDGLLIDRKKGMLLYCPPTKKGRCVLPSVVKSIDTDAFAGCTLLTEIVLPDAVTGLYGSLFEDCHSLRAITVSVDNPEYTSVDGILFTKDGTRLIRYPHQKRGAYMVPDGVTQIDGMAFSHCSKLIQVVLPFSVEEIEAGAFCHCNRLVSIEMDEENPLFCSVNGVLYNGDETSLLQCPGGLSACTIPSTVTYVEEYAFAGCSSLSRLSVPPSVSEMERAVFEGCRALKHLSIYSVLSGGSGYAVLQGFDASRCVLHVPEGMARRFRVDDEYGRFGKIVEDLPSLREDYESDEE